MNKKTKSILNNVSKADYLNEKEIHRARMEEQLFLLKKKAKKTGTSALIVGGVLLVGYIVVRKLLTFKKEKELSGIPSTHLMVQKPKNEPAIVTMIKEQIALFLIAIIKEKLTAYIKVAENRK